MPQASVNALIQKPAKGKVKRDVHLIDLTKYLFGEKGKPPRSRKVLKAIVKRKGNVQLSQIWDIAGMGAGKTTRQMGLAEFLVRWCPFYNRLKWQLIITNDIAAAMGAVEKDVEFLIIIINDVHQHHASTGGVSKAKQSRVNLLFEGRHHVRAKTGIEWTFILIMVNGQEEKSILDWMKKNIKLEGSVLAGDNDNALEWQERHLGPYGMAMLSDNALKIDDQQKDEFKSRMVVYIPGRSTKFLRDIDLMDPNKTPVGYVMFPIPTLVCNKCGYESNKPAKDGMDHPFFPVCPECGSADSSFWVEKHGTMVPELTEQERQRFIIEKADKLAIPLVGTLGVDKWDESMVMEYLFNNLIDEWWFFVDNTWARKRLKEAFTRRSKEVAEERAAEALEFLGEHSGELDEMVDRFVLVAKPGKGLSSQFQAWLHGENEEIWNALANAPSELERLLEEVDLNLGKAKLVKTEDDRELLEFLTGKMEEAFTRARTVVFDYDLEPKSGKLQAIYQEVCRREREADEPQAWVFDIFERHLFHLTRQIEARLNHSWHIAKMPSGSAKKEVQPMGEVKVDSGFSDYIREWADDILKGLKLEPWYEFVFRKSEKGVQLFGGDQLTQEQIRQMVAEQFNHELEGTSRISQVIGTVKGKMMRAIGLQREVFLAEQSKKKYEWVYSSLGGKKSNEGLPDLMYLQDRKLHVVSVKCSTQERPVVYGIHDLAPEYLLAVFLKGGDKELATRVSTDECMVRPDFAKQGQRREPYNVDEVILEMGAIPEGWDEVVLELDYYNVPGESEQRREIEIITEVAKYQYPPFTGDNGLFSFLPKEGSRGRGK